MSDGSNLTFDDRFTIFEQLNLHQRCMDDDRSRVSAKWYVCLYWPEAKFIAHDILENVFEGPEGLKQMYDFAHSVFPMHKWAHSMGAFEIKGSGCCAEAAWRWIVSWKEEERGYFSTGTYLDKFEKREGIWKCLERVSIIDPNHPRQLLKSCLESAPKTFKAS